MIESKPRSLKDVLEQAKTYSEVFQEWQLAKSKTVDGIDNKLLYAKWVSAGLVEQELSLLQEKERSLKKLLDEFPCSLYQTMGLANPVSTTWRGEEIQKWFEVFVGEFEGLSALLCERPALENGEEPALRKEKENRAIK